MEKQTFAEQTLLLQWWAASTCNKMLHVDLHESIGPIPIGYVSALPKMIILSKKKKIRKGQTNMMKLFRNN